MPKKIKSVAAEPLASAADDEGLTDGSDSGLEMEDAPLPASCVAKVKKPRTAAQIAAFELARKRLAEKQARDRVTKAQLVKDRAAVVALRTAKKTQLQLKAARKLAAEFAGLESDDDEEVPASTPARPPASAPAARKKRTPVAAAAPAESSDEEEEDEPVPARKRRAPVKVVIHNHPGDAKHSAAAAATIREEPPRAPLLFL